jgi:hypothetical protein
MSLGEQNVAAELSPLNTAIHDLPPNGVGYINGNFYNSSRLLLHDGQARGEDDLRAGAQEQKQKAASAGLFVLQRT